MILCAQGFIADGHTSQSGGGSKEPGFGRAVQRRQPCAGVARTRAEERRRAERMTAGSSRRRRSSQGVAGKERSSGGRWPGHCSTGNLWGIEGSNSTRRRCKNQTTTSTATTACEGECKQPDLQPTVDSFVRCRPLRRLGRDRRRSGGGWVQFRCCGRTEAARHIATEQTFFDSIATSVREAPDIARQACKRCLLLLFLPRRIAIGRDRSIHSQSSRGCPVPPAATCTLQTARETSSRLKRNTSRRGRGGGQGATVGGREKTVATWLVMRRVGSTT